MRARRAPRLPAVPSPRVRVEPGWRWRWRFRESDSVPANIGGTLSLLRTGPADDANFCRFRAEHATHGRTSDEWGIMSA